MRFVDLFELRINDSSAKMAFFMHEDLKAEIAHQMGVTGIKLKENLMTNSVCFVIGSNNFIFELAETVIERFIQAGIVKYLFEFQGSLKEAVDDEPEVFSLNDLSFGFFIWLVACSVTLIVFACEVAIFWARIAGKKLVQNIIGLIYFVRLLKQRLQTAFM